MQNPKMRINFFPFQKSVRTFGGVESIIKNPANISSTTGLRFLGFGFLGLVYEAHQEAHQRSKPKPLKPNPLKPNPYKIYDRFTSPVLFSLILQFFLKFSMLLFKI